MMSVLLLLKGLHAFKCKSMAFVLSALLLWGYGSSNVACTDLPLRETWKGKTNLHGLWETRTFISQNLQE